MNSSGTLGERCLCRWVGDRDTGTRRAALLCMGCLEVTLSLDRGDMLWSGREVGESLPDSQQELRVGVAAVHHGWWACG